LLLKHNHNLIAQDKPRNPQSIQQHIIFFVWFIAAALRRQLLSAVCPLQLVQPTCCRKTLKHARSSVMNHSYLAAVLAAALLVSSTVAQSNTAAAAEPEVIEVAGGMCISPPKVAYFSSMKDCKVPAPIGSRCSITCAKK
jgi:hypothetical protein